MKIFSSRSISSAMASLSASRTVISLVAGVARLLLVMTAALPACVGRKKVGREREEARAGRDEDEVTRREADRRSFEVAMAGAPRERVAANEGGCDQMSVMVGACCEEKQ